MIGRSGNYGATIRYNLEYACLIGNKYLLVRGWSYSKHSLTTTLISNYGFFLENIPSRLTRKDVFKSNDQVDHPQVGFMFFGPIKHNYERRLNLELVSTLEVLEVNIKLKQYKNISEFIATNQKSDLSWLEEIEDEY